MGMWKVVSVRGNLSSDDATPSVGSISKMKLMKCWWVCAFLLSKSNSFPEGFFLV